MRTKENFLERHIGMMLTAYVVITLGLYALLLLQPHATTAPVPLSP